MRELEAHTSNTFNTCAESFQTELAPFTEAEVSDFSDPAGLIDLAEYVHAVPPATVSLTNSPGCTPAGPTLRNETDNDLRGNRDLRARPMRTVRVDAWAAPASASWSRTRTTVRKASSQRLRATSRVSGARSTDWALPF